MEQIVKLKEVSRKDGFYPCGFLGCGNMAMAIVAGLIKAKIFEGSDILISGTKEASFDRWKHLNVHTTLENKMLFEKCRIVFLSVKPNMLNVVAKQSEGCAQDDKQTFKTQTLVSMLAGTSIESLSEAFRFLKGINYIRVMPNTPLMVCAGATAMTSDEGATTDSALNFQVVKEIFGTLGLVEVVEESKFHAITGVSGSGPAYVYIMIEALSDGGVKQGLPRDLATKFAAQTLFGAAKMILETGTHPGQAKDQVTSAGGTTIHAVHELEKGRIRDTLMNAVEAATKRSMEMSKK